MTERWKDVRCASIPVEALATLADVRDQPEIRVSIDRARAWISWETDSDAMRAILVRRILPTPGAELFTRQGGHWYRLGAHLPAFDVPLFDVASGVPLNRVLLPTPVTARRPAGERLGPQLIRLVRDEGALRRPTTALRATAHVFAEWADRATSADIASLEAVCAAGPDGLTRESPILILGTPGRLPLLPGSTRYWGADLLVPLGFRVDPELPDSVIRRAAGADTVHLVVFENHGFELIPRALFRPVNRAAIRLACGNSSATGSGSRAREGGGR
jgi:hypothetical protein